MMRRPSSMSLAVGPLAVFGTSSGGNFALWMLTRHPATVRGAVLHEPGVYALLDDFDAIRSPLRQSSGSRWTKADHPWRWSGSGNTSPETTRGHCSPPRLRERLRASASTVFDVELGTYERPCPTIRR